MRMIQLTKITADRRPSLHTDTDEPGENGNVVELHAMETAPVTVNVDAIRCFYPRKDERPGTRLTFTDGGGFAVAESYDTVGGMVTPAASGRSR